MGARITFYLKTFWQDLCQLSHSLRMKDTNFAAFFLRSAPKPQRLENLEEKKIPLWSYIKTNSGIFAKHS